MKSFILYIGLVLVGGAKAAHFKSYEDRCNGTWMPGPTTVNTTLRLSALRDQLQIFNLSAYIISSDDDHQSEYVATHDERRAFISGFTGSEGNAVVTLDAAALWTDSRYYIQADEELDCNWELIPTGESSSPSIESWLSAQLSPGAEVSADPKTIPFQSWESWRIELEKKNVTMRMESDNLVDMIWGDQPSYPEDNLYIHDVAYAGQTWQQKLESIREEMTRSQISTLILTALDEIAWLLNLRGGDVPYTPVFRSYLVIDKNSTTLYLPSDKHSQVVEDHLNSRDSDSLKAVRLKEYTVIWADLQEIGETSTKIGLPKPYSYAGGVSYLLHTMLPANKIIDIISPALIRKDTKNEVEAAGMRKAHLRDAVALCVFFDRIGQDLMTGKKNWTELTAAAMLDSLRWNLPSTKGPSFETIAAFGTNAALPHYAPSNGTDKEITTNELFLIDSGGQFYDGTTDVTRTVHFGSPRQIEIDVYTKLLMGCIDVVTTIFPEGKSMGELEILIRRPLYSLGLDYGHGSTHGIGTFLSVHEAFNTTYHENFFGSQEPGYYKEGDFGIRLENIVTVVKAKTLSNATNYLTFDTVTLVPYQRNLINVQLLEDRHVEWINHFHDTVKTAVTEEMNSLGIAEMNWLNDNTKPISK